MLISVLFRMFYLLHVTCVVWEASSEFLSNLELVWFIQNFDSCLLRHICWCMVLSNLSKVFEENIWVTCPIQTLFLVKN